MHRRFHVAFGAILALLLTTTFARATPPSGYELAWADEFDGAALDVSEWLYRADEKQRSIQLPSNVEVADGALVLNLTPLDVPINGFSAAGAGIVSRDRFRYGYYEARAKLGDGVNDDNDSLTDEGWHHAFWAMLADENPDGTVSTTFPDIRRTEIDAFENGSTNLQRLSQHVLPWNEQGQIIQKLPSDDITMLPDGTIHDWHTYGFEWTPNEVRFYVDDVFTHAAVYPVDQYEHTDVNVWLTAISTNAEDSDQELSSARYDYFRYYSPEDTVLGAGDQLAIGDEVELGANAGGAIVSGEFGGQSSGGGGLAGNIVVGDAATVHGVGALFGNLTAESGGRVRVGGSGIPTEGGPATSTSEDFESFAPGDAFVSGSPTALTPNWEYHDLGANSADARFVISGADGSPNEPTDGALTGESQMLFQRATGLDYATEAVGGEPFAGAVAVAQGFDTSGPVDVIEADFVFDGYGDNSGSFLDSKLVFGFRDIDNWFSLSIVAGATDGASTQVDVIANIDGERQNVFARSGTGVFSGAFPQDELLHARVVHDAQRGYVQFRIERSDTGEVLAESFVLDDRFKADGSVGFAVNNDATGYDNLTVTTLDQTPLTMLQTLTVQGDYVQQSGAALQMNLATTAVYDRLVVEGSATLAGVLDLGVAEMFDVGLGSTFLLLDAGEGVLGGFESVLFPELEPGTALELVYGPNGVSAEVVLAGDYNADGVVDAADYAQWRTSLGDTILAGTHGDLSGDGVIGAEEFMIWRANYGATAGLAVESLSLAAPEPAGAMLAILPLAAATLRRGQRPRTWMR